jgi:hypothetical protein
MGTSEPRVVSKARDARHKGKSSMNPERRRCDTSPAAKTCAAPTVLTILCITVPALPRWANICRTSGARDNPGTRRLFLLNLAVPGAPPSFSEGGAFACLRSGRFFSGLNVAPRTLARRETRFTRKSFSGTSVDKPKKHMYFIVGYCGKKCLVMNAEYKSSTAPLCQFRLG